MDIVSPATRHLSPGTSPREFGFTALLSRAILLTGFQWRLKLAARRMSSAFISFFFRNAILVRMVLILLTAICTGSAAETNNPSRADAAVGDTESLRAFLQLQEQLRATQQALERAHHETEAATAQNAEALQARLAAIERAIESQRAKEVQNMQSANRVLIVAVGSFALIGLAIMLVTAYLQWRALHRLAEVTAMRPAARPALPATAEAHLLESTAAEQVGARLLGALDLLEKRIAELESTAQVAAPVPATTGSNGKGHPQIAGPNDHIAVLLARGESLLGAEQAEEALACFDRILETAPAHAEALVKKGAALEQLRRLDEALVCYDRAIETDSSLTMAYLQKGGLYNRLERYEEALKCYEQALRTQEKSHAA